MALSNFLGLIRLKLSVLMAAEQSIQPERRSHATYHTGRAGQGFLDGTQRFHEARVMDLTANIDNLPANSAGIDDHQFIDKALRDVIQKLAAERDNVETVVEYRKKRSL